MLKPHFFGAPARRLYGGLHEPGGDARGALLICAPLLQEYARTYRALWTLAEQLAAAGIATLRFDYFGTGDSGGAGEAMSASGAIADVATAYAHLAAASGVAAPRVLGFRSGALMALAAAARASEPADLILWDAELDAAALAARWRALHTAQYRDSGRFVIPRATRAVDERVGFRIGENFESDLLALDAESFALPARSRVTLASFAGAPASSATLARVRATGADVATLDLESDRPNWDGIDAFELMAFPRRSVGVLAKRLA